MSDFLRVYRPRPILTSSPRRAALLRSWGWTPNGYSSHARQPVSRQSKRAASWTVVLLPSGSPKDEAAVTEACIGDCSINLDSRKGRHIKIGPKNWGTVWGTIVPKHGFFDPKTGLTGQAKLLISEQQAPGPSNLLNRCRVAPGRRLELCTQTREWKPTLLPGICEEEPILALWSSTLVAGFPLNSLQKPRR
jgi:hypothetical protein